MIRFAMKRLHVVVSLITQDNDYQVEQAAAAQEAADRLGVDVEILYADGDSIQQSQQILKFVQAERESRPHGIVLEPVGGTGLPQVARAAVVAGISWAVLNRELEYVRQLRQSFKVPVFGVSSDNLEIGRMQAQQLAALLPKGGTVLYIQGPAETDAAKLRTKGIEEAKSAAIHIKAMKGSWTEASAFKAVTNWLRLSTSQSTHVDAVAAQNDAMAYGAKKALEDFAVDEAARERWLNIPFLGCDGVPKTGQAWVRNGVLAATVVAPALAGQALEMMAHALQSHTIPQELTLVSPRSFPSLETLAEGARRART
jgi:ABC-type sugar transport system substrate-binding protein